MSQSRANWFEARRRVLLLVAELLEVEQAVDDRALDLAVQRVNVRVDVVEVDKCLDRRLLLSPFLLSGLLLTVVTGRDGHLLRSVFSFVPRVYPRVRRSTGSEYAAHLQSLADFFELPVSENTDVKSIENNDGVFHLETEGSTLLANNVIWAAGEFLYPRLEGFDGSELCRHTATVANYGDLEGDDFLIVGGYESGVDAAYHLARRGKRVRLFDMGSPWEEGSSDPSVSLSTFSFERMRM